MEHEDVYMVQFDTRDKKPKIYNIAVLTAAGLLIYILLFRVGEPARYVYSELLAALYFGTVVILLLNAFRKQLQYNPYSYNTILYTGFALFTFFIFCTHLREALLCLQSPESFSHERIILTLLNSAKNYLILTAPFLLVFSIGLFVSNVWLIRNEGRHWVNILGMIAGFLVIAGQLLIGVLDYRIYTGLFSSLRMRLAVNLMAAFYLYFECMLLGAMIADLSAAFYEAEPNKDFLIVLGCGIRRDGTPTPLLKGRLDLALQFYRDQLRRTGKKACFVVSGGKGSDEVISEAQCMKNYLLSCGIPEDQILMEDRSTDTAENMRFSRQIIQGKMPGAKVAFFTTNYHVFRAGLKARRVKMRAVGMGAPTKWYFWSNAAVREFVGLLTEHKGKQILVFLMLIIVYTALTMMVYA